MNQTDLRTIYDTITRAEEALKHSPKELNDLFAKNPRLIISPSNRCAGGCTHCVAESAPDGKVMPYSDFSKIDERFFGIFSAADFGRRGNPMLYHSGRHDISDIINLLNHSGMKKFTIAAETKARNEKLCEKLRKIHDEDKASIDTMLTYHHYFGEDNAITSKGMNESIKNCMKFSDKIIISLLGDNYQNGKLLTKADEVQLSFNTSWKDIFSGISMKEKKSSNANSYSKSYIAEHNGKKSEINIPAVDTRVYPLGRFRKNLSEKGILEDYETKFEKSMGEYMCPDLIKWPGIIIEPNGDLNLCASFEAITSDKAIISNIFKPYDEVKHDLMQFHRKELDWFVRHVPEIADGKISMCKIKNNCYKS